MRHTLSWVSNCRFFFKLSFWRSLLTLIVIECWQWQPNLQPRRYANWTCGGITLLPGKTMSPSHNVDGGTAVHIICMCEVHLTFFIFYISCVICQNFTLVWTLIKILTFHGCVTEKINKEAIISPHIPLIYGIYAEKNIFSSRSWITVCITRRITMKGWSIICTIHTSTWFFFIMFL